MGMKNDEPKRPPKSILYYYGIVLIIECAGISFSDRASGNRGYV